MLKKFGAVAAAVAGMTLQISAANAAIITHTLVDHPDGSEAPPVYGLRLDGLFDGNANDVYTFSFVEVTMTIDTDADTVNIAGELLGGSEGEGEDRDTTWFLDFTYDTNIAS